MIEGMSRAEIRESLPEGFCDDCWQQSLERAPKFGTDPEKDYHDVFYVTHVWDGIDTGWRPPDPAPRHVSAGLAGTEGPALQERGPRGVSRGQVG